MPASLTAPERHLAIGVMLTGLFCAVVCASILDVALLELTGRVPEFLTVGHTMPPDQYWTVEALGGFANAAAFVFGYLFLDFSCPLGRK